jgi:hypothetical protein
MRENSTSQTTPQGTAGGPLLCDFCRCPLDEAIRYSAESFIFGGLPLASLGDWAACPECSRLIEDEAFGPLAERAADSIHNEWGDMPRTACVELMTELYSQFKVAKTGHSVMERAQ